MSLHEVMLQDSEVLDSVNVKVRVIDLSCGRCPTCFRHGAVSVLHGSLDNVLSCAMFQVDYLMSASSLAEHGHNLVTVNHYELCAEKKTEQKEWWNFIACM